MEIIKYPLKVRYCKSGEMVYFSQLDIMHIFDRALRRTELPLYFTQGFTPRLKMSFGNALKLGVAGESEVTFYFLQEVSYDQLCQLLSNQLPEGLHLKGAD
ncbi:MAG: DUF2344 domain-containing protein [Candidatus Omnitrophica bacterium]|nr:DUF2344 domain-containing protein [Candidatus Omnitrophota bacterium]